MVEIGLEVVLNSLDKKIDGVVSDVKHIDQKLDGFILQAVTKQEFDAYTELRTAMEKDSAKTRRSTVQWAVTTIISVLVLLVMVAAYIVSTRPPPIVVDEVSALLGFLI
jgi:hypothetical protein